MPWDEVSYWVSEHLNNKLGLHFSLVSGAGHQATAIRLDEIVARAELNRSVSSDFGSHPYQFSLCCQDRLDGAGGHGQRGGGEYVLSDSGPDV